MFKKIMTAVAIAVLTTTAFAWEPPKTITIITSQGPGGGNEIAARGLAQIVEKNNPGTNFVFSYKPGGNNAIAWNYFNEQKIDGSNVLIGLAENIATAPPVLGNKLNMDASKFIPVTIMANAPLTFVVGIDSPIKTVPQLIEAMKVSKASGKKFNFGIGGGVTAKVVHRYLIEQLGIDYNDLPSIVYPNTVELTLATSRGELDVGMLNLAAAKKLDGVKTRIITIASDDVKPGFEKVPLFKDYVKGMSFSSSWCMWLPIGTPKEIVMWYESEFKKAQASADATVYFDKVSAYIDSGSVGTDGAYKKISEISQKLGPVASKYVNELK